MWLAGEFLLCCCLIWLTCRKFNITWHRNCPSKHTVTTSTQTHAQTFNFGEPAPHIGDIEKVKKNLEF